MFCSIVYGKILGYWMNTAYEIWISKCKTNLLTLCITIHRKWNFQIDSMSNYYYYHFMNCIFVAVHVLSNCSAMHLLLANIYRHLLSGAFQIIDSIKMNYLSCRPMTRDTSIRLYWIWHYYQRNQMKKMMLKKSFIQIFWLVSHSLL